MSRIRILRNFLSVPALVMLALLLSGCLKNEFTISITLPQDVNSTYKVTYYGSARNGGIAVEAAIAVAAGKGELKGITRNPTVVSLYDGAAVIPSCVIYAERGDEIKLTGKDNNPAGWDVSGNKINTRLTEWRLSNRKTLEAAMAQSYLSDNKARQALNEAVSKFVEANPKSVASLILLGIYYDASIDSKGFRRLLGILDKSGVLEDYPDLIARQDMLTMTEIVDSDSGKKLRDIVVKSLWRNIDTLRFNSGKRPMLIYLWQRMDPTRRADIDSLRSLLKWRGDSASMPVADICLDTDSIGWVNSMAYDSLENILRAWMPRGIADPDLMEMGVAGSPWWIVTGADGKIQYAGSDNAAALEKFQRLKKK